jgi:hypothetical protein
MYKIIPNDEKDIEIVQRLMVLNRPYLNLVKQCYIDTLIDGRSRSIKISIVDNELDFEIVFLD